MKRILLVITIILSLASLAACSQSTQGTQSSVTGMNEITKCKVTADQAAVRTGCSDTAPVAQTCNKDTKLDVINKVGDYYAVKLPNNQIGFVPQSQCTPVVSGNATPGTKTSTQQDAAPGTAAGTAPGNVNDTKQKTPDDTEANNSALTAQEQEMLNLVNQARSQNNVPALQIDMELTKMARVKSQDMIDNKYFSHNSPKYGSPFDMMKSFGIDYVAAGENIAGNQTVQKAHDGLMNSPGHRKNILSTEFTHIGIGIRKGGPYGNMFTQDFISKPQ